MKISEFLVKNIDNYREQSFSLQSDISNIHEKIADGEKSKQLIKTKKFQYERKAITLGTVGIVVGILGGLTIYLNVISPLTALVPIAVFGGIGYGIYKKGLNKLKNETDEFKTKLNSEQKELMRQLDLKNRRILEINNIIEHLNSVTNFFDIYNHNEDLDKIVPISENQLIFCLENDMSLLSILYLANSGLLPDKGIDVLAKEELREFRIKVSDIDRLLKRNPAFFFGEEEIKIVSRTGSNRQKTNDEVISNPILLFDERGFVSDFEVDEYYSGRNR